MKRRKMSVKKKKVRRIKKTRRYITHNGVRYTCRSDGRYKNNDGNLLPLVVAAAILGGGGASGSFDDESPSGSDSGSDSSGSDGGSGD